MASYFPNRYTVEWKDGSKTHGVSLDWPSTRVFATLMQAGKVDGLVIKDTGEEYTKTPDHKIWVSDPGYMDVNYIYEMRGRGKNRKKYITAAFIETYGYGTELVANALKKLGYKIEITKTMAGNPKDAVIGTGAYKLRGKGMHAILYDIADPDTGEKKSSGQLHVRVTTKGGTRTFKLLKGGEDLSATEIKELYALASKFGAI